MVEAAELMGRIKSLGSGLASLDTRCAKPPLKEADAELLTAEHRAFRSAVLKRAGWRCEVVENGVRCPNRHPRFKLYADHIKERQDGGDLFDPENGLCRCASHHTIKTNEERAKRLAAPLRG